MARSARQAPGALSEEGLDDAVFQRMEGDHHQPAALAQHLLGGLQTGLQFVQLGVDGDAQGLKGAGGRMHLGPAPAAQGALDGVGQVQGALERRLGPAAGQGGGDAARLALLTIEPENAGQLGRLGGVDQVGGALALARHAHVQRPVAHEREAAIGLVQLHGRHAQVQHHSIHRRDQMLGQGGEAVLDQAEAAAGDQRGGEAGGGGIAVEGDHLGPRLEESAAVAAGAEGAIDHHLARLGRQRGQHLGQQHGLVRGAGHAAPTFWCGAPVMPRPRCGPPAAGRAWRPGPRAPTGAASGARPGRRPAARSGTGRPGRRSPRCR